MSQRFGEYKFIFNFNNLVGKARIIFFSNDKKKGSFLKFWKWNQIVRKDRLFKKIQ